MEYTKKRKTNLHTAQSGATDMCLTSLLHSGLVLNPTEYSMYSGLVYEIHVFYKLPFIKTIGM